MVAKAQIFVLESERKQPFVAEITPVRKPFEVGSGFAEKFKFHLLEFAHAENKVSGCDFVTEGLAYLTDTERHFLSRRTLNVYEVGENTLSGFGAQINGVFRVLGYALESFEHQVKLTDIGEVVMLARGAGNVVLFDESFHFGLRKRVDGLGQRKTGFRAPVFDEFVGAETLVTLAAIEKRIGKSCKVTACHPGLRIHENCGVQTDVVAVFLNELLPPRALYIVFEFDAQRTVVPGVGKSAVDFAAGKNKASALAERNQFIHSQFVF